VRGANSKEDISYFVKQVVFYLHPSFQNPKRGLSVCCVCFVELWCSPSFSLSCCSLFIVHISVIRVVSVVEKPPFEITETGWGEFDLLIVLYFTDPSQSPLELVHYLKVSISSLFVELIFVFSFLF
jgi:YEATS domain-containing protein 4